MPIFVKVNKTAADGESLNLTENMELADALGEGEAQATETSFGTVQQAAFQAAAAGANPTKAEYDALLAALIAAGIMAAS